MNNNQFIVCRHPNGNLEDLRNQSVVFYINDPLKIKDLENRCKENQINVHCIVLEVSKNLSEINFSEYLLGIPLAIHSNSVGRLSNFLKKASIIKRLNVRFYFSTNNPDCYKDIRILASLGYSCSLIIDGLSVNWDALNDLMTYALLNPVKHAEIHPFQYIEYNYDPQSRTEFSNVEFINPEKYLHYTKDGKIALEPENRLNENSPMFGINEMDEILEKPELIEQRYKWQKFFLKQTECGSCKGWRICLGKFDKNIESNPGCSIFFGDFLDILQMKKDKNALPKPVDYLWQP